MNETTNTVTYVLTPISNSYWLLLERGMQKVNLHSGQVFVLLALLKTDGQSQIELSKYLNLAAPTVNKMIKSLLRKGFVRTEKDISDGRIVKIFITPEGLNCQEHIELQWQEIERKLLLNFTETEKLILFQLLDKLKNNLSDI